MQDKNIKVTKVRNANEISTRKTIMNCGNTEIGGVYGHEEKKFIFNNVIVGRKAKARFKISNTNKVSRQVFFLLGSIQCDI